MRRKKNRNKKEQVPCCSANRCMCWWVMFTAVFCSSIHSRASTAASPESRIEKNVSLDHTRNCIYTYNKNLKIHVRINSTVKVIRARIFIMLSVLEGTQRVPPTCIIKTDFTYLPRNPPAPIVPPVVVPLWWGWWWWWWWSGWDGNGVLPSLMRPLPVDPPVSLRHAWCMLGSTGGFPVARCVLLWWRLRLPFRWLLVPLCAPNFRCSWLPGPSTTPAAKLSLLCLLLLPRYRCCRWHCRYSQWCRWCR